MSYQWTVGELAVCVDDRESVGLGILRAGGISVVREFMLAGSLDPADGCKWGEDGLWFHDIPDPPLPLSKSTSWLARCFRPLIPDDYARLTEKHKDSLPKRSLVKDDAEAWKRIEELERFNWGRLFENLGRRD